MKETFDFQDAQAAANHIKNRLELKGLEVENLKEGLTLGSGLSSFTEKELETLLNIPYNEVWYTLNEQNPRENGVEYAEEGVYGHPKEVRIGYLKAQKGKELTLCLAGREHPYEGYSLKRVTFWLRVMQLLGIQTWLGSNAAGVVTPETLKAPGLMLVHSDYDERNESPLWGSNDDRFGPRFPNGMDQYHQSTRELISEIAKSHGVNLAQGTYIRSGSAPSYERPEDVYRFRNVVEQMWHQGKRQPGEERFNGKPKAAVGMSSTYEMAVAQHASQSRRYPAFQKARGIISACTNYSASLGPEGILGPDEHLEVARAAQHLEPDFIPLIKESLTRLRGL